jgi:translation initiation factor IF-3
MSLQQALAEARARSLDLIEVAPQANPPVCRIMDWGKFRYEQQKKAREAHKRTRQVEIKSIRMRPNTDDHDIDFKMRNARRFLSKGDKVKLNVIFRGPELRHKEIGERQLQRFAEGLADVAQVAQATRMEGRQMIMVLEPRPEALARLQAQRAGQKKKHPEVTGQGEAASRSVRQEPEEQIARVGEPLADKHDPADNERAAEVPDGVGENSPV